MTTAIRTLQFRRAEVLLTIRFMSERKPPSAMKRNLNTSRFVHAALVVDLACLHLGTLVQSTSAGRFGPSGFVAIDSVPDRRPREGPLVPEPISSALSWGVHLLGGHFAGAPPRASLRSTCAGLRFRCIPCAVSDSLRGSRFAESRL